MKTRNGITHCANCESRDVPAYIEVPLLIEVGFKCPFPECSNIDKTKLEFHHIFGWSKSKTHDLNEMIAVCPSHHYSLDRKVIPPSAIKEFKRKLRHTKSQVDSLFLEDKPTLLTRLNFEGRYTQSAQIISKVINYCRKNNVWLPYLPELAVEKAKALRKVGTAKEALNFVDKFEERWSKYLTKSKRLTLDLSRGYILFNELEFDSALQFIQKYKDAIQEINPIGSEADIFEIYQRLIVINWNSKKLNTDLDRLLYLSNAANDKIDILLTQAVVQKKAVSIRWINDVEEIVTELNQSPPKSPFSLGYETHALAELLFIAAEIFKSRGRNSLADHAFRFCDNYFGLVGWDKKLKVWHVQ